MAVGVGGAMMTIRTDSAQRGVALILVLGFIAVLSVLVYSGAERQRFLMRKANYSIDAQRASVAAEAALATAQRLILRDSQVSKTDDLREPWAQVMPVNLPQALVLVRITDVGQRFNVNAVLNDQGALQTTAANVLEMLLAQSGQDPRMIGEIVDWIDGNDELSPIGYGREAADYAAAGLPFGPRNDSIETRDEFALLPSWQRDAAELSNGLLDASAACPRSRININTASPDLLANLQPLFSTNDIQQLVRERTNEAFISVVDAFDRIGFVGERSTLAPLLAVASDCFWVDIVAKVNRTTVKMRAEIRRELADEKPATAQVVRREWMI